MKAVETNLYVGTTYEARHILSKQEEWRLVNVAKTLHYAMHGWSTTGRYSNHPYYVVHEEPTFISVNWVDGSAANFNYQNKGVDVVKQILAFIGKKLLEGKKVLISCDQAQSRSPSVAMLYLAKVLHIIPDTSFREASIGFSKIYPEYNPAIGISSFLTENWSQI